MCGICGTTREGGTFHVAAMNAALAHRGPDDDGFYLDGRSGVALGARRLSIIDVAGGHQPLSNERGNIWAVMNGEIYNHPRMQEHLLENGHELRSRTDTEVLVHLYEDYGVELVHALEGMFAFAIWDVDKGRLLLARDRFGEKPLFYVERGGDLAFASEITALARGTDARLEIDAAVVDDYFTLGYVPGSRAMVRGVRQLEPGSILVWDERTRATSVTRYWSPTGPSDTGREPQEELVAETRRLLEESVQSRMLADVPLGVFLSGGVDSTLIAALAARLSSAQVKTFSVGYSSGAVNELDAAAGIAELIGTQHHGFVLTDNDVVERAPRALAMIDQPIADPAFIALHALAEFARREVTVAVGGEGADELFGGYPRYQWLSRSVALHRVLPARLGGAAAWLVGSSREDTRRARIHALLAPMPVVERHLRWIGGGRQGYRVLLYGERLQEFARSDKVVRWIEGLAKLDDEVVAGLMRLDQSLWLPDDVLVKADRASMQASLELRTPYLNRELSEFVGLVPPGVLLADEGKSLVRSVVREVVPGAAYKRRKTAFRVPVADWLRGPLREAFSEQLRSSALYSEGWFSREPVSRLFDDHIGGQDRQGLLWPIFALGAWLDTTGRRYA